MLATAYVNVSYSICSISRISASVSFQVLDGEHDDRYRQAYEGRCKTGRDEKMNVLRGICQLSLDDCLQVNQNHSAFCFAILVLLLH